MMAAGLVLLPCAFLKNLHAVSSLSFWNGVVHTVINAVILGYCILHISTWGWAKVSLGIDILSFPIALGVIVFSYTSQIFLPTLEGNMQDKSKFHCMLNWSHVAAAIFKALFGYVGFLTFQEDTSEEVVNNLPQGLKVVVNLILVVKALLSYPLPYYAACELIEWELFKVNQEVNKVSEKAEYSTVFSGKTRNQVSHHMVSGRRFESVGSRLQGGRGCLDHPLCHRHPSFYHFDGLHWQLHRLLFVLHLAGNVPLEIASAHNELDGHGL